MARASPLVEEKNYEFKKRKCPFGPNQSAAQMGGGERNKRGKLEQKLGCRKGIRAVVGLWFKKGHVKRIRSRVVTRVSVAPLVLDSTRRGNEYFMI